MEHNIKCFATSVIWCLSSLNKYNENLQKQTNPQIPMTRNSWNDNLIFTFALLVMHHKIWYFVDRASHYIYLNINQLDPLNFLMSLFNASTCFEHMCSSSEGQNCTIQSLVSSHVMITEAVYYNFDLLTMSTCARNM